MWVLLMGLLGLTPAHKHHDILAHITCTTLKAHVVYDHDFQFYHVEPGQKLIDCNAHLCTIREHVTADITSDIIETQFPVSSVICSALVDSSY